MENWISSETGSNDIVISSRVRLARNIKNRPFPHKETVEKGRELAKEIEDVVISNVTDLNKIHLWEIDKLKQEYYFERHLISPKLIENNNKASLIVSNDETVSLMINEEDHLRIQSITSGLNLEEAYKSTNELDDILEDNLEFAFDESYGYLTACPTNIGTGLRASAMIHLPALTINGEINKVLNAISQVGMTIRGLYGEGSKGYSNLYQISNQITLGLSEEDIINNLSVVIGQVVNQEYYFREKYMEKYKYELEDRVFRALGILRSAILIDIKESLKLISDVRMGIEMGIIKGVKKSDLNYLMINIQPSVIQMKNDTQLSERDKNLIRADLIRNKLK